MGAARKIWGWEPCKSWHCFTAHRNFLTSSKVGPCLHLHFVGKVGSWSGEYSISIQNGLVHEIHDLIASFTGGHWNFLQIMDYVSHFIAMNMDNLGTAQGFCSHLLE